MNIKVISSAGCTPCKMVKQFLGDNSVEFQEINVSDNPEAGAKYGVMSTPVTILFDGEEEVSRVMGFNPSELEVLINQL